MAKHDVANSSEVVHLEEDFGLELVQLQVLCKATACEQAAVLVGLHSL